MYRVKMMIARSDTPESTQVEGHGSYHPPEKVAEVMTLLAMGHSSIQASRITGVPASTIRDMSRSATIVAKYGDAIKAGRERLAYRWTQIAEDALDRIETGEEKITAVAAMTGWGIVTDKIQKDAGVGSSQGIALRIQHPDGTTTEVVAKS